MSQKERTRKIMEDLKDLTDAEIAEKVMSYKQSSSRKCGKLMSSCIMAEYMRRSDIRSGRIGTIGIHTMSGSYNVEK